MSQQALKRASPQPRGEMIKLSGVMHPDTNRQAVLRRHAVQKRHGLLRHHEFSSPQHPGESASPCTIRQGARWGDNTSISRHRSWEMQPKTTGHYNLASTENAPKLPYCIPAQVMNSSHDIIVFPIIRTGKKNHHANFN